MVVAGDGAEGEVMALLAVVVGSSVIAPGMARMMGVEWRWYLLAVCLGCGVSISFSAGMTVAVILGLGEAVECA